MRVRGRLLGRLVVITLLTLLTSAPAFAGKLKVRDAVPNTVVTVVVKYKDGTTKTLQEQVRVGNTEAIFGIEDQENVETVTVRMRTPNGNDITYDVKIKPGETTLSSLEPFDVPTFVAADLGIHLFTSIDIPDFLVQGNSFTTGQLFTVTQGSTFLSSSVFFRDAMNNPFTGTVRVHSFDSFEPVPEPAALLLLGTGLAGVAAARRRRGSKGK